jgi:hypothetical protein
VQLIDCIGLEDEAKIAELVERHNCLSEPYPMEPFQVLKKKAPMKAILAGEGDLFLGAGVVMDSSAWLVLAKAAEG